MDFENLKTRFLHSMLKKAQQSPGNSRNHLAPHDFMYFTSSGRRRRHSIQQIGMFFKVKVFLRAVDALSLLVIDVFVIAIPIATRHNEIMK